MTKLGDLLLEPLCSVLQRNWEISIVSCIILLDIFVLFLRICAMTQVVTRALKYPFLLEFWLADFLARIGRLVAVYAFIWGETIRLDLTSSTVFFFIERNWNLLLSRYFQLRTLHIAGSADACEKRSHI